MEIFKFQRPIYSSIGSDEWLAYNEERDLMTHVTPTVELANMMGDDLKAYVQCKVMVLADVVTLEPIERVADQNW